MRTVSSVEKGLGQSIYNCHSLLPLRTDKAFLAAGIGFSPLMRTPSWIPLMKSYWGIIQICHTLCQTQMRMTFGWQELRTPFSNPEQKIQGILFWNCRAWIWPLVRVYLDNADEMFCSSRRRKDDNSFEDMLSHTQWYCNE